MHFLLSTTLRAHTSFSRYSVAVSISSFILAFLIRAGRLTESLYPLPAQYSFQDMGIGYSLLEIGYFYYIELNFMRLPWQLSLPTIEEFCGVTPCASGSSLCRPSGGGSHASPHNRSYHKCHNYRFHFSEITVIILFDIKLYHKILLYFVFKLDFSDKS